MKPTERHLLANLEEKFPQNAHITVIMLRFFSQFAQI